MRKLLALLVLACLALGCRGVNYHKPKPLNYDEMGLETHHRGVMSSPAVGSPDEERLGHEKLDKLRKPGAKPATGAPATAAPTAAPASAPASAAPATSAPAPATSAPAPAPATSAPAPAPGTAK